MADDPPTAKEFKTWLTPRQALNLVNEYHFDMAITAPAIMGRLAGGIIRAAALRSDKSTVSPVHIPAYFWDHLAMGGQPTWWDTGDIKVRTASGTTYRFFDVKFDKTDVEGIVEGKTKKVPPKPLAAPSAPTPAPAPQMQPQKPPALAPSRAGRPRKDFWDDLIIAICKRIWDGDLQPQTQADIERAMLDWASKNGHEISETSVKAPAKKIFLALQT